jgi:pimeloyl-ACP methyl ester carboxylesterase
VTAVVGDPAAAHLALVAHGILGAGRNWRGLARTLADRHPTWRFALPDLRGHAGAAPRPPPHTVAACAADLADLCAEIGEPELVVGHSFGGKVALAWAARHGGPKTRLQILDCPPGPASPAGADALAVLAAVRAAPVPSPDRGPIRAFLRDRGISEPVVAWLATSLVQGEDGWRWGYDIPAIDALLADFFALDCWPFLLGPPAARVRFLRAGRSDRWTAAELGRFAALPPTSPVSLDVLAEAGHWLHVDDPEGTMRWMAEDLT